MLAAPAESQYPPAGQGSHVVAPAISLNIPGGHELHPLPLPVELEAEPGEQGMHEELVEAPCDGR